MLTTLLRKTMAKKKEPFLFKAYDNNVNFAAIPGEIGLYIHIPFCRTLCPYCPYNKTLYDKNRALAYQKAVLAELAIMQKHLQGKHITSVYIGGGTPTLMLAELQQVLAWIRANLMFHGDVGIEVYPQDIDKNTIAQLKGMGVNLVSVGVQTFNDWHLRFLGRGYSGNDARRSLELIKQANFDCVDIDIMFNLPGQTWEDIEHDLRSCYSYAIEQLSIYPLILFPLTALPQRVKKEKLHTFNSFQEYGLLRKIEVLSAQMGYSKTSIWTYGKYDSKRYTSITRESFVGIGASASSLFGKYFYLNTFNVEAYITRLATGRLPINLVNAMTPREKMIFWLFWRCYDTVIDTRRFKELFGVDFCQEFTFLAWFMQKAGLAKKIGHRFELTRLGSYLYHLVEKQYSLTYLNKMWSACMKNPWLEKFAL